MLKYYLTAAALKGASCCSTTRKAYRFWGNTFGQRQRRNQPMPFYYLERVKRNVSLCTKYDLLKPGDQLLELGTGWVHWEALTLRLFFEFQATLYDVWDNRQFDALKIYMRQLGSALKQKKIQIPGDVPKALRAAEQICRLDTLDQLYDLMGFKYVLDPAGELKGLPDEAFAIVISAGVLEHVHVDSIGNCLTGMTRTLKPGGHGIHSINITDHLYLYDRRASPKQYLRYSERMWKTFFENQIQYINRLQRSEWLSMFSKAGMNLLSEDGDYRALDELPVHKQYRGFDQKDLECLTLDIFVQKR